MEKLPLEITADILSRLPMALRLQCREVCKTWQALLPKPKMGLLYGVSKHMADKTEAQFYFSEQKYHKVVDTTKLDLSLIMPPTFYINVMAGSCNGLVCYVSRYSSTTNIFDRLETETRVHVCNPVTGEHIQLPTIKQLWAKTTIGFGYARSSNEYKVVSIQYPFQDGNVQVYTLGGGTGWRNKLGSLIKGIRMSRLSVLPSAAVLAGGALHWMDTDSFKPNPVAFDLEHETFESLPSIPSDFCSPVDAANYVGLMELGGIFCVLHAVPSRHMIIWELSRHKETVKHGPYWRVKFTIQWEDHGWFEPSSVPKCNKCYLWCNVILSCYDPENGTLEKLEETLKEFKGADVYSMSRLTPHVNSLVSLKALAENSWREKL